MAKIQIYLCLISKFILSTTSGIPVRVLAGKCRVLKWDKWGEFNKRRFTRVKKSPTRSGAASQWQKQPEALPRRGVRGVVARWLQEPWRAPVSVREVWWEQCPLAEDRPTVTLLQGMWGSRDPYLTFFPFSDPTSASHWPNPARSHRTRETGVIRALEVSSGVTEKGAEGRKWIWRGRWKCPVRQYFTDSSHSNISFMNSLYPMCTLHSPILNIFKTSSLLHTY